MKRQLSKYFYSLKPNAHSAAILSNIYKEKAILSIYHIINSVNIVLKVQKNNMKHFLDELRKFNVSTELYVFNAKLIKALLVEKNLNKVVIYINEMPKLINKKINNKYMEIVNIDKYEWSSEFARETVQDANHINGPQFAEIYPIEMSELQENINIVKKAIKILSQSDIKEFYEELLSYVNHIFLFDGKGVTGGSSARSMGAIYIRRPYIDKLNMSSQEGLNINELTPLIYFVEQIIHETAHLHLDQLMEFDPIILNPSSELYNSPIRIDLRPMRGVFHATYVLSRLCMFFESGNKFSIADRKCAILRLVTLKASLAKGIETIKNYAQLTAVGAKIFKEMGEQI